MAKKLASQFFATKLYRTTGNTGLFIRGRNVASAWFDKVDNLYCVAFADNNKFGAFKTFAEADLFAWMNFHHKDPWPGQTA